MKLEKLVYAVVQRVFAELEHAHHFVVPEDTKKAVIESVQQDLDSLIT